MFLFAISKEILPPVVVNPRTSILVQFRAIKIANASSIPGSVSIIHLSVPINSYSKVRN